MGGISSNRYQLVQNINNQNRDAALLKIYQTASGASVRERQGSASGMEASPWRLWLQ